MADDNPPEFLVQSGVSAFDGLPFVLAQWGSLVGQLTCDQARQLGTDIIGAAEAAELDAAVFAELRDSVGLSEDDAGAFIMALRARREER